MKKTDIVARLNNFSADDVQQFAQFKTLAKSYLEDYLNKKFPSSKIQINEFESNSNQTNDFASWGINGSQQSFLDKYESGNVVTFQPKFSTEEMKKI
ncbi:hypothetical protein [Spiroplasma eriocheiris]|uniref:Uncharacterized protein n=1 Tax=Spiroplasma eriocheiris TaxID=315358 RepID=A0A0H3XM63_9MOLU|nr:hypothetical protein [Spiroplasma eriocheiris]AHF58251.1 hypothetical protein SPE_1137 [Spiroplasma eriocheiris CCTCC M 207170]AKM54689.1 hypothetical protein SERIO_v1c11360 [Spiroplasma eriocheiris]